MVCIQRPEYGGGEIRFDGKLIRKDGLFVRRPSTSSIRTTCWPVEDMKAGGYRVEVRMDNLLAGDLDAFIQPSRRPRRTCTSKALCL